MTTAEAFKEFREWLLYQAKDNFRRDKGDIAHAYANAWLAFPDWAENESTMQCCCPVDEGKRMTWDDVYVDQKVHHKYFGWGIVDDYNDNEKYGNKMIFVRFFNNDGDDEDMKLPTRSGPFGCMRYAEFGAIDCFDDWSTNTVDTKDDDTEPKKILSASTLDALLKLLELLEKEEADTTADSTTTGVN